MSSAPPAETDTPTPAEEKPDPAHPVRRWLTERPAKIWDAARTRADLSSSILVLLLIILLGWIFVFPLGPKVTTLSNGPRTPKPTAMSCKAARSVKRPVKVSPATGSGSIMNIYIGRGGNYQKRQSIVLAIQKARLCPRRILSTAASDFVQTGGEPLKAGQVSSWAKVDSYGTHVIVYVVIAPRRGTVSGFGAYSGTVRLNDRWASGGNVAVHVHVRYPYLNLVFALACLAAFAGFAWAWLIHDLGTSNANPYWEGNFLRNLILRTAVVLTAIPVASAQVLSKPDWQGSLGQYVTLGTIVGAAAIAATPTLRVLALPTWLAGLRPRTKPAPAAAGESGGGSPAAVTGR